MILPCQPKLPSLYTKSFLYYKGCMIGLYGLLKGSVRVSDFGLLGIWVKEVGFCFVLSSTRQDVKSRGHRRFASPKQGVHAAAVCADPCP